MRKNLRCFWCCLLLLVLGATAAQGAQEPTEPAIPPALKERIEAIYKAVKTGDRKAALEIVSPETRDYFFGTTPNQAVAFHILAVQLSEEGNTATVSILRTQAFPGFPAPMDYEVKETWKLIDGQWYLVLPAPREMNTPFGKFTLGPPAEPGATSEAEKRIQEEQKNIDPDQFIKALEKAEKAKAKQKPAEQKPAEQKPAEKKKADDSSKPKL